MGPHARGNAARHAGDDLSVEGSGQQRPHNDPCENNRNPQYANDGAPRTRKRHQQEHRPQRPTERSDPTQHAKGRTGDRPGPRKGATTRRTVTRGGGRLWAGGTPSHAPPPPIAPSASFPRSAGPPRRLRWTPRTTAPSRTHLRPE